MNKFRKKHTRLLLVVFLQLFSIGVGNLSQKRCREENTHLFCYNYDEIPKQMEGTYYVLDLADKNNILEKLPTDGFLVARFTNLTHLFLQNCQIREIETGAFRGGENISTLVLSRNEIEVLNPSVFQDLINLNFLNLSDNPLRAFQGGFPRLPQLTTLEMEDCLISSIEPDLFKNLENLEELELGSNLLVKQDLEAVVPLKNLEWLWLDNNEFKSIDKPVFRNLRNLGWLMLDSCELQSFSRNAFQGLENLLSLYLSHNQFTTLNWKVLEHLKNLRHIWLEGTQWNCSCSTLSLLNFFRNKSIKIMNFAESSPSCQYTSHLVGQNKTLLMEALLNGSTTIQSDSEDLFCSPGIISLSAHYAVENADLPGQEKTKATLQCDFNGFPPGVVHWKKNGDDLDFILNKVIKFPTVSLQSEIESDYDFRQEVVIKHLDAGDVGEYECSVSNPAGISIQTTTLSPKILDIDAKKPKVTSFLATENDSEHVTLKCVYNGVPRPKVKWIVPNPINFLNESGHVVVNPNGIWYQTRVFRKGFYRSFNATCHVRNYLGEDEATIPIEDNEPALLNEAQSDAKVLWILALVIAAALLIAVIFFIQCQKKPDRLLPQEISGFFIGSQSRDAPDYVRVPYDEDTYEIHKSRFQIHEDKPLGHGAFGIVCEGTIVNESGNGNETVAVKMTKTDCNPNEIKGLLSELKLLPYLGNNHTNIVKLVGAYTKELTNGKLFCFLELCSLGSLKGYLRKLSTDQREFRSFSEETIELEIMQESFVIKQDLLRWSKEIATALEFIASKNIVHADIATRNVLVTSDKTAKISDFGLSRRLYQYQSYVSKNQMPLPWKWMSPEALRNIEFTEKSDVWSFGVALWEIWSLGDEPFPGLALDVNFPTNLEKGFSPGSPRIQQDGIFFVMTRCWTVSPESRPTFTEVKDLLQSVGVDAGPSFSGYENIKSNSVLKYENVGFDQEASTSSAVMNPGYI